MHIWVWQEDQVYARFSNHKRSLIVEPIKYEKGRGLMKAQIVDKWSEAGVLGAGG